jgi:hypothetical protein
MVTTTPSDADNSLDSKSLKRLENAVLYALAASSAKLEVPAGTRIWQLYDRRLDDLFIKGQRREWMWDHIDYGISLIKAAKRVNRASPPAKAATTVKDVWTVVLQGQPGSPVPKEGDDHA